MGNEIVNDGNESNMQLESLLSEIDDYGEGFFHCGKSYVALDDQQHESDCVSNNDVAFTDHYTKSTTSDQNSIKPELQSYVALSEKASCCALKAAPKSKNLPMSSVITRVDSGSNVILVTSPSFLYNVTQTTIEVGITEGGTAQTAHVGDLHMTLEDNNTVLLTMK